MARRRGRPGRSRRAHKTRSRNRRAPAPGGAPAAGPAPIALRRQGCRPPGRGSASGATRSCGCEGASCVQSNRYYMPACRIRMRFCVAQEHPQGRSPMGKLDGKVALVTGSGRNIGRATVLQLAGEGAHVVVNARSNEQEAQSVVREAEALGVKALAIIAVVGKKDEVEAMAQKALGHFGRVDILINNAAIRPHKPFLELTDDDYERVRSVVLDGAFWLTRAIVPSMVKNKYGQILFFVGDGA